MPTPRELRSEIQENRARLQSALHGTHARWETKPGGATEGEESWSPKEVVQHMVGAEFFFTNAVAQACGAPPMERPQIDVSSPAAAAGSTARVGAACDNILRHVSDADLEKNGAIGSFGEQSVAWMLQTMIGHGKDHLNQLAAASG
jgi:hypothetical protein